MAKINNLDSFREEAFSDESLHRGKLVGKGVMNGSLRHFIRTFSSRIDTS